MLMIVIPPTAQLGPASVRFDLGGDQATWVQRRWRAYPARSREAQQPPTAPPPSIAAYRGVRREAPPRRGPRSTTKANPAQLTRREFEVLQLVSEGHRNGDIAERLVVSRKTIDHHVSAILRKLGVRNRGEATATAHRLGIVSVYGTPSTASPRTTSSTTTASLSSR
jgi:DNA-binding CsgD family transcriptional regulator